jgi:uncharacterized protein with PQ loop repeat
MFFSHNLFIHLAIWVVGFFFLASFVSQVMHNYKLKSVNGLSDLFIIILFDVQFLYACYAYYKNLLFAYKFILPLDVFVLFLVVLQRLYYAKHQLSFRVLSGYVLNFLLLGALLVVGIFHPILIAKVFGWLPLLLGCFVCLPQMIKVYKEKTLSGFSLNFILLNLIGYSFELLAGLKLNVPAAILFNDFRGIFVYLVFILQFFIYNYDYSFIHVPFRERVNNDWAVPSSYYDKLTGLRAFLIEWFECDGGFVCLMRCGKYLTYI